MADDPPALEQHHCDVGANFVRIDRLKQTCTSNFKPSSRCCAIQIIPFVLIAMNCMMHELVRVIGKEKVLRIFIGRMPVPEVSQMSRKI